MYNYHPNSRPSHSHSEEPGTSGEEEQAFLFAGLTTDTSIASISLESVLSGGPGKDGIPAINEPAFVSIRDARVDDDTLGVFVSLNDEKRFYPYTILVWHEIVNDSIGDTDFAVTFCPLCGSAIVFDRSVDGETLTFGVSGFLFESNLLMYDTKTESLWSQAKREAVVGAYTGTVLSIIDMQLLTFGALKENHPNTRVLSQDTGYSRNYNVDPYTGYGLTDELYFPVSVADQRFPAKDIFYVVPFGSHSIALPDTALTSSATIEVGGVTLTAQREADGIRITTSEGKVLPGYYEMWFSWATHHQNDGIVWEIE